MPRKHICPFKSSYKPESKDENGYKSGKTKSSKVPILDKSAALAKLEQLNKSRSLNLVVMNLDKQYKLSSYTLFKMNLLDPVSLILIIGVYMLTYLFTVHSSQLSFIILFVCIYYPINYHLESYRSFVVVTKNLYRFRNNVKMRNNFLSSLAYKRQQLHLYKPVSQKNLYSLYSSDCERENKKDTFRWANQLIKFFWPYLSHLIHCELDQFFHAQIESDKLANSDVGTKKFCAALIKQLKSNILEIKRCQFGSQSPEIKNFTVTSSQNQELAAKLSGKKFTFQDQFLTYDLDLEYNGNMVIKVIYRYFFCCSSKLGLEDVYLRFKIRILLGPIKPEFPFVDTISFTLLDLPDYGYKGIALVELAELRVIRGIINRMIKDNILYPKLVPVSMKKVIRALKEGPKKKEQFAKTGGDKCDPCLMKFLANSLLCCCMCLNVLLKPCHETRGRHSNGHKLK